MTLRRSLVFAFALLALLVGALVGAAIWFVTDNAGLDWATGELTRRSSGNLVFEGATGSLAGSMRAARITYRDVGWSMVADDVELAWSPRALFSSRRVAVTALSASRIHVDLQGNGSPPSPPPSLALPLSVDVDRLKVDRIDVVSGSNAWQVRGLALRYHGDAAGHRLDELALDSDWGALHGAISIGAVQPLATAGSVRFAGSDRIRGAAGQIDVGGDLSALKLSISAQGLGAQASGTALIAPFEPVWLRELKLAGDEVDLSHFDAALPRTLIRAELAGAMAEPSRFEARVEASNGQAGPWSSGRLPLSHGTTRLVFDGDTWTFDATELALTGRSRIQGTARFAADELHGRVRVEDLDLAAIHARLRPTRLTGGLAFDLSGASEAMEGAIKGELSERGVALAFDADLGRGRARIKSFRARGGGGSLEGSGTIEFTGKRAFDVEAAAARLDPAAFGAYPSAAITGKLAARGALEPEWFASVSFKLAPESRWRKLPLAGAGTLDVAREHVRHVAIDLSVGENRVHFAGDYGQPGELLALTLDAPDLAAVNADFGGRLKASGQIGGAWTRPSLSFVARADALRFESFSAASLALDVEIGAQSAGDGDRSLRITGMLTDARKDTVALHLAQFGVSGTLAKHEIVLTARSGELDLDARLTGGWLAPSGTWSGQIVALENRGAYPVSLTESPRLEWRSGSFHIAGAGGTVSGGRFALRELIVDAGRWSSSGEFTRVPASAILAASGQGERVRSTLVLSGRWSFAAAPRLNGTLSLTRDDGDIAPADAPERALGLSQLELAAASSDDRIHATLTARSRLADADATADISPAPGSNGRIDGNAPLKLSLRIDAASLRTFQALAGTTAVIDGRVSAQLGGEGTLRQVRLTGTVTGDALRVEAPHYGMFLRDGTLRARLDDRALIVSDLSFSAGDGRFVASGTLPSAGSGDIGGAHVVWRAEKLRLLNRPDARLVLSGNGTLALEQKRLVLGGTLRADDGHFEFRRPTVDALGDDVVVRGRKQATAPARARVPFAVDLDLDFGESFEIIGVGLDAVVSGKVHVATAADGTLEGRGTINAQRGTYTAYGQRLTIERGKLYFDGPLDNPGLDVLALRKNLEVEAGVEVTGTVRAPQVRLTSTPPVSDNEKLAWLVLGHSADRANNADLSALQLALSAATDPNGAPLGQRVAGMFGFDDISVRSAAASRTSAPGTTNQVVAVSKRLTDNLSLVYEQGISVANNALKIEYALTREITLRAEAGVVSGVGIYYSRSFD
jgi:translocation and assembly module TamB